jgi:hypothetical protein
MVLAQVGAQSHALLYVESRNRHLRGRRALCSHSGGAVCWLGVDLDAYPHWVRVEVNVGSVRCLVERMESVLAGGPVAMNCPGTTNLYLPKLGCWASVSLIYSDSISSRILSPFCFADYAPSQGLSFCRSYISPFTLVVGSSTAPSSLPRRPLFSFILSPHDPCRRRGDAWHATVAVFSTSHLLRQAPSAAAFAHSAPGLVSPRDIPIEASGELGERRAAASDGHHTPRARDTKVVWRG